MSATLAVADGWLDCESKTEAIMAINTNGVSNTQDVSPPYSGQYTNWYGYPSYVYVTQSSPARPIKLTLSEVERLRKAARADKALKTILEKFTPQIEVTVDFE